MRCWLMWACTVMMVSLFSGDAVGEILAQDRDLPDGCEGCRAYLVTMAPGDALFTVFGHIAIRVVHADGTDEVFDYGTYDGQDPQLVYKFLVGTLAYHCQSLAFVDMVAWYKRDFGGISAQELDLSPGQIARLYRKLVYDSQPEHSAYAYHHFYNNCSTKIRNLLDEVLGGELSREIRDRPAHRSIRDMIDASMYRWEHAAGRWVVFGLLNHRIDGPADRWEQTFLPYYLAKEVATIRNPELAGTPMLVKETSTITGLPGSERPAPAPWFGLLCLALLVDLGALAWFLARWRGQRWGRAWVGFWMIVWGGLAMSYETVLWFAWAVSPYPETKFNWALLVFHPLHLVGLVLGVGLMLRRPRWLAMTKRWHLAGMVYFGSIAALSWFQVIPQRIWHYGLAGFAISLGLGFALWSLGWEGTHEGTKAR